MLKNINWLKNEIKHVIIKLQKLQQYHQSVTSILLKKLVEEETIKTSICSYWVEHATADEIIEY